MFISQGAMSDYHFVAFASGAFEVIVVCNFVFIRKDIVVSVDSVRQAAETLIEHHVELAP